MYTKPNKMFKKKSNKAENREMKEVKISAGTDGKWGWFVVFNSFLCNMIVDGMQYTFANFLMPIAFSFNQSVTSVSLIGSILSGFYNFSGPIAGALGNKFGFRMVIITGSLVSSGGLMLSYFAPNVKYLYFFYGVLGGLGFGMIYMASVIMTSLYFEKYRALAASLSVCGTGVGTFVFAPMGTWIVAAFGWRYAFVAEGGIILICIICGLSFKPLEIIKLVPISRKPSEATIVSSQGTMSLYFGNENKKILRNDEYPTFKEALQMDSNDDRRSTIVSLSGKSRTESGQDSVINFRRQLPTHSVVSSLIINEKPETPMRKRKRKLKKNCRICCFRFWHCRCKDRELTLGDRPLYRDDIFYGGSLTSLRPYSTTERLNYHLSVTRVPDAQEVEEHVEQKCCVCHQAFLRTWITMLGFNLLRSSVFVFLCVSSFLYTMSLYIPYVFIRKVASDHKVPDDISVWLVSAIGISNTAGRLSSGIIKSFVHVNAGLFALVGLIISGVFSFIFIITVNLASLFVFSCIFGFFTAPFISLRPVIIVEFLGLEKLTNAFGLVLLSQGIASIIGPPAAGALEENTGRSICVIYFSGSLMLVSSIALMVSILLHRKRRRAIH